MENVLNQIDILKVYKDKLINLGKNYIECKFITDSFIRWYFNSIKCGGIVPYKNIVCVDDLIYANINTKCTFDVDKYVKESENLFKQCTDRLKHIKKESYVNKDFLLSKPQLDRLNKLYVGKNFEHDKNKLISIYEFIGTGSIHLSVPPILDAFECFGSPMNTHYAYCSPFAIDKKFGSNGSFFNYKLSRSKHKLFIANPPFDEKIMEKMAIYLHKELQASKSPKVVIITIPVWDSDSQKKLEIRDYGMRFRAYELLIECKFFKESSILNKDEYLYWDYYKQTFVGASFTHLIILSNTPNHISIDTIKAKWLKKN